MYPESSLVLYKLSQTDTIASSDLRVHPAHPFSRSFLLFSRKAVPSYTSFIYALPPRPHASSHTFASLYRLCWHSSVSLPCPLLASLTPPIPRLLLATRSRNHSLTSVPPTRPTAKMPRGSRDPREERTGELPREYIHVPGRARVQEPGSQGSFIRVSTVGACIRHHSCPSSIRATPTSGNFIHAFSSHGEYSLRPASLGA